MKQEFKVKKEEVMKMIPGFYYVISGCEFLKGDYVAEFIKEENNNYIFWDKSGKKFSISKGACKLDLPTELEHAYPGAEIKIGACIYSVSSVGEYHLCIKSQNNSNIYTYSFVALKNENSKLIPQTPPPDTKAEECIKYLEDKGLLKDGRVLK